MESMTAGFRVAYRAGCVMGFFLVSAGLLILALLIMILECFETQHDKIHNVD